MYYKTEYILEHFQDWLKTELDAMIDQSVSIAVPELVPSPRGFGASIERVEHIGTVLNSRVTLVAPKNVKYPVYKCELRILNKNGKKEWLTLNDAFLKVL